MISNVPDLCFPCSGILALIQRNGGSKQAGILIEQMSTAYDNKCYVETVWYCYAIFEQRINRLISKYIDKCKAPKERIDKKTVSISIRINCLKQLSKSKYGAFDEFDYKLLIYIQEWCNERNELVHGLVSLKYYKEYDKEFTKLAEKAAMY